LFIFLGRKRPASPGFHAVRKKRLEESFARKEKGEFGERQKGARESLRYLENLLLLKSLSPG